MNYFDEARLSKYASALQKAGFDLHIHAIGDRGVREALNALETAADGGQHRHRLTHLEIVDPEDLHRFAKLGVTADVQVSRE
jgi:predicted amidohydrolase YtcJ